MVQTEENGGEARAGVRWIRVRALRAGALGLVLVSLGAALLAESDRPLRTTGPEDPRPPDILLVLIDTLRADYLGAYGFDGDISPRLDRLARRSVVFENAFSTAPWTKPSVASLFTSLHPEQHGVVAHGKRFGDGLSAALAQRVLTLAEFLRRAGYRTAAFIGNPWIQRPLGYAQGFQVFDDREAGNDVPADVLLGKATAWLQKNRSPRPFFLYVQLMDVHGPYDASPADYEAVEDSPGLGEDRQLTPEEQLRARPYLSGERGLLGDPGMLRTWRGSYAAGVHAVDRQLGVFLDDLERRGRLENAVVVVTSDHGEELFEHGFTDHGATLFDEQLHVPLLFRLPGGARAGTRIPTVVSLIDVMPTLLAFAGVSIPPFAQGRDLGPLLRGGDDARESVAYATAVKWAPHLKAARAAGRKVIRDEQSGEMMSFDLLSNPGEIGEGRGEVPELVDALDAHAAAMAAGPSFKSRPRGMKTGTAEKLRSLGYLE